jgi:hypothetical protein
MYTITCLHCNRSLRIREDVGKTKMKCRFCGAIFVGSTRQAPAPAQPARPIEASTPPAIQDTPEPSRETLTVHARSAGPSKNVTARPNVAPRAEKAKAPPEPPLPVAAAESTGVCEPPEPQKVFTPAKPPEPPATQHFDEPLPEIETSQPKAPSPQPAEEPQQAQEPGQPRRIPTGIWIALLLLCLAAAGVGLFLLMHHADAGTPLPAATPQSLCPGGRQIPLEAKHANPYDWDAPSATGWGEKRINTANPQNGNLT